MDRTGPWEAAADAVRACYRASLLTAAELIHNGRKPR